VVGVGPDELLIEEVRRFRYPPTQLDGHLRWNLTQIFDDIKAGIRTAADACKMVEAGATRIGASASVAIISGGPATRGTY